MLLYLNISNFALIKETKIQFHKGLNVLSGETGSGKSIIFEALGVALGERANKSMIKSGEKTAVIEACFLINDDVREQLKTMGCDSGEDTVLIRRDLFTDYPSVSRINGFSVTLNDLKKITRNLCDIFGQYEHQLLLDPQKYISIVDSYLPEDSEACFESIYTVYWEGIRLQKQLRTLRELGQTPEHDIDYLEYKIHEIESASLRIGEDEEVFQELKVLENHKDISEKLGVASFELEGSFHATEASSILDKIQEARQALDSIAHNNKTYQDLANRLKELYYEAQDIQSEVQHVMDNLVYDEERRIELNERLQQITNLKKKYGNSIEEVLQRLGSLQEEIAILKDKDYEIQRLEQQITENQKSYERLAKKITSIREDIAKTIEIKIQTELKEMEMKEVSFVVDMKEGEMGERGNDRIEFLVATNKGSDLKPIKDIISGGEMSRFMLAFKNVLAEENPNKTFIFDEIDAGLSGKAANSVGKRLRDLSHDRQVLIISHLPQIISKAEHHYKIMKESMADETISSVSYLSTDERVEELARLLSGDTITKATLENARELLEENEVSNGL